AARVHEVDPRSRVGVNGVLHVGYQRVSLARRPVDGESELHLPLGEPARKLRRCETIDGSGAAAVGQADVLVRLGHAGRLGSGTAELDETPLVEVRTVGVSGAMVLEDALSDAARARLRQVLDRAVVHADGEAQGFLTPGVGFVDPR